MGIFDRFKRTKPPQAQPPVHPRPQPQTGSEIPVVSGKQLGADPSDSIVRPLISEKSAHLAGSRQYVFVVRKDANRVQVRSAIKSMYGIAPVSVNLLNVRGKKVKFSSRQGARSDWKKAIVTLPVGQTINIHEGV